MNFVVRMAMREIRSSWRRLLFFFICIGVGVGSIVGLRSTLQNANSALVSQARLLLGADVQIDSTRALDEAALSTINRLAQSNLVSGRTETVELPTMARPNDASKEGSLLVELKAVGPGFPLYGDFTLADGRRFDSQMLEGRGAIVGQSLLERLSLKPGDELKIGEAAFQIRGVISADPGGGTGFRLGPRVFIARSAIEETGLAGFGSRARHRVLLSTTEQSLDSLVKELRAGLKSNLITVRTYKESEQNINEQYTRSENYLSLVGLVILVLGGIGIANVTRVFIEQKKKAIAVLKCLGATSRRITVVYVAQVLALGAAGSVFGIVLAKLALLGVGKYFAESLPANMSQSLRTGTVIQGLVLGLLISFLFSALPLLRVRHIRPNLLLRNQDDTLTGRGLFFSWGHLRSLWRRLFAHHREMESTEVAQRNPGEPRKFDWVRWSTGFMVLAALVAVFSWQAGSLRVGAFFLGGLAATALLLQLASAGLMWVVKRTRHIQSFPVRHAINSLHRPGNQTRVIIMAVGLGAFLVIAVQSLQRNLLLELDPANRGNLPNMYLIDIQKDQKAGVEKLIQDATGEMPELIPTIRARITAINGREINLGSGEMRGDRGRLGREYVVTYRPALEANETIVAGKIWDATPSTDPEVSISEDIQGLQGLDLGSTITLDIIGRKLTARVTSVRRIDWRKSRTGFLILFRPNVLDNAPTMYVGGLNGPSDDLSRSRLQRLVVEKYPNVSIIDVAEVIQLVKRLLGNVTLAVTFVGGFVLFSGTLILIGSVAMTRYQRAYEAALLKTLGATRKTVLTIVAAEYGLLGLIAGLIGSVAALALSYSIARFIFAIPWSLEPIVIVAGIAGTIALVVLVGLVSSLQSLSRKPLGVLRAP
ncbi:MAG TPA: FtsX-like permease family protein [Pyrinomonadaceae bacterium]|nr:FtsX-like permease family protein [Pyrinomonadaceae bacterium]